MNKIIEARKKAGFTQDALAAAVGCTQGNLSHIETGKQIASVELAKKLSEKLGIPVTDILFPAND